MNPGLDAPEELTRLTDDEILALVQTRSRRFQRQIRFRDWRELIAGGFAAFMTAPVVLRGPMLARAGALIVVAGVALVAFRLWRARRQGALDASDLAVPVATALRAELEQVDAQITLLRGVAWWYVAPLVGGSVLLVAGARGQAGWAFTLAYTVGAGLLAWAIIALNRSAVRRRLAPRRMEILALLRQIES